jgi:putative peptide zinc metalloprotease protein
MMPDEAPKKTMIPWILRQDLEVFPADEGNDTWTIKDPVRLTYFRVDSEELEFLRMLNGRQSLEAAVEKLMQIFPDLQFAAANLGSFLTVAIRAGLLIQVGSGYGQQLAQTARTARSSAIPRKFFSLISHRFRGIDPTRLLQALDRRLGWIFRREILTAAAVFVIGMAFLIVTRWSQLKAELPTLGELLTVQNLLSLGIAVVFIKILHEIGHGLTCCHYGGECHELGCIVIGFLPLLYCDVSDSWRQQHQAYRIQVAAAGIAVELFLAAICGMLWMASIPGLLHSVFLNIMLVCSLNTVLINGNPLLRYDGYYVLSDALRLPNLGPESRMSATAIFDRFVLGLAPPSAASTSGLRQIGLPLFGAASMVYRLVVLSTILLVIHSMLKPYRLEAITWLLAVSVASGMLFAVSGMVKQRARVVGQSGARTLRAVIGLSLLSLVVGIGLFWPLPYSINAPFTLTPGVSSPVYVSAAGRLQHSSSYGDTVEKAQPLVRLANPQLTLEVAQLEGELKVREARVTHLASTRGVSPTSAMAIPAAEKAVQSIRQRLQTLKQKTARLNLQSPESGVLYPPRRRQLVLVSHLQQQFWHGTPLDQENHSAWLEEQTLLCWVGSSDRFRATVYVSQQDIEFVAAEADVLLEFHSQPAEPLSGTVVNIGSQPEADVPPELTATGALAVNSANGTLSDTRFVAHVQLEVDQPLVPPLYSTGLAKIQCRPTSLAARCWRLLSHTFAFEM